MHSDSEKKLSAYDDQNHALSLTEVRLEYKLKIREKYVIEEVDKWHINMKWEIS